MGSRLPLFLLRIQAQNLVFTHVLALLYARLFLIVAWGERAHTRCSNHGHAGDIVNSNEIDRGHILLVDDSPELIEVFSLCLEAAGYKVSSALNGVRALDIARLLKPDAVILDIWMPALGGLGLAAIFKSDPNLRNIPLGLITAATGLLPGLECAHFTAVLAKPCSLDEILGMAEVLLLKEKKAVGL